MKRITLILQMLDANATLQNTIHTVHKKLRVIFTCIPFSVCIFYIGRACNCAREQTRVSTGRMCVMLREFVRTGRSLRTHATWKCTRNVSSSSLSCVPERVWESVYVYVLCVSVINNKSTHRDGIRVRASRARAMHGVFMCGGR